MPPGFETLVEWGPPYVALGLLVWGLWKAGCWLGERLFGPDTGIATQYVKKQIAMMEATTNAANLHTLAIKEVERQLNDLLAAPRSSEEEGELINVLMDQLPVPLAQVNEKGFFMRTNSAMRQVLGYTEDEMTQLSVYDVTPNQSDVAAESDSRQKVIRGILRTFRIEKNYRRKDGMDVFCALYVMRFPQAGPFRFFVSCVVPLHAPHTLR